MLIAAPGELTRAIPLLGIGSRAGSNPVPWADSSGGLALEIEIGLAADADVITSLRRLLTM